MKILKCWYLSLILIICLIFFIQPLYSKPTENNEVINKVTSRNDISQQASTVELENRLTNLNSNYQAAESFNRKKSKKSHEKVTKWDYLFLVLVLMFAATMAGLTIGLMSLDATNLEILKKSGTKQEREYAKLIEPIRKRSHLLLCTLLLANTVANESLPILMDPIIGSGWRAILGSSALIVVFGEIIPQAVCTRYGLYIGAKLAWLVQLMIFLLYPFAWPIAKTLDWMLGESHGVAYRRAELKELVQMHDQVLIPEEVRIIKGVLDLREKTATTTMTPLRQVFALDYDGIVDKLTIEKIIAKGHSRIPVYKNGRSNLIGVVLVKRLISLKHRTQVHKLPLAPLPKFHPGMPLFECLAYFQQGKSHMAAVVPDNGFAIGIITLEDVLEELIGTEIVDETDEFMSMETKIKVTRHINHHIATVHGQNGGDSTNSPSDSKRYSSCFASPRCSPCLVPDYHLPATSFTLDDNSSTCQATHKLVAKSGKDYLKLADSEAGDLVLVTTVPGTTLVGQIIDPWNRSNALYPNHLQAPRSSNRPRSCDVSLKVHQNSSGTFDFMNNLNDSTLKKQPLLVVPKLVIPKSEPQYHLVNMPTKIEPEHHSFLQPGKPDENLQNAESQPGKHKVVQHSPPELPLPTEKTPLL